MRKNDINCHDSSNYLLCKVTNFINKMKLFAD